MSEHTPGPWTYKTRGLLNGSSWPKHSLIVGPEAIVLNGIPYYHPDDAAILAAAPDLLEACENFVFEFADLGEQLDSEPLTEFIARFRALIAKARPQS